MKWTNFAERKPTKDGYYHLKRPSGHREVAFFYVEDDKFDFSTELGESYSKHLQWLDENCEDHEHDPNLQWLCFEDKKPSKSDFYHCTGSSALNKYAFFCEDKQEFLFDVDYCVNNVYWLEEAKIKKIHDLIYQNFCEYLKTLDFDDSIKESFKFLFLLNPKPFLNPKKT